MDEHNGNVGAHEVKLPYLTITLVDVLEFKLHISGQFPNLDYALHMLDQARRELEAQWRLQRAAQHVQQAADQQLVRDLTLRR